MSLKFSILASGSTGNAMVVENEKARLLVDAGLSARRIEQLMSERDTSCSRVDAILVTHEHSDHVKGLGPVARRFKLPIYANEKTWARLDTIIGEIDAEQRVVLETGGTYDFDTLRVESYPISHDAADPVGYCFYSGEEKLSLVTDLGYISPKVKEKVVDSDVLILEANHDIEMLRVGSYPWNLKRRILGDTGHLSNQAAGEALGELISSKTKRIYLAHLSREHNMLDLARMTVNSVVEEFGIHLKERNIRLMDTYYDRPTAWDVVGS